MDEAAIEPSERSLVDLPAEVLRKVATCMWADARGVEALACCCRTTRDLCSDPALWKEITIQRFGEDLVPEWLPLDGMPPTPKLAKPVELEGFVFYQGRDGSRMFDKQAAADDLQQLAQQTTDAGAEAFTTSGKVIRSLKPQPKWHHSSFRPQDGTYVRQEAVQRRQL